MQLTLSFCNWYVVEANVIEDEFQGSLIRFVVHCDLNLVICFPCINERFQILFGLTLVEVV